MHVVLVLLHVVHGMRALPTWHCGYNGTELHMIVIACGFVMEDVFYLYSRKLCLPGHTVDGCILRGRVNHSVTLHDAPPACMPSLKIRFSANIKETGEA